MSESKPPASEPATPPAVSVPDDAAVKESRGGAPEIGGRASGLDPTRYGDWEKNGRCIDF